MMHFDAWKNVARSIEFTIEPDLASFEKAVPKNSSILDFGCGYGRISQRLYELGYQRVLGIDSSLEMVTRAKSEFPHLDVKLHQDNKLPYKDESFDAVVLCAVLTCIPNREDQARLIDELLRVLRSGGTIHIAEFGRSAEKTYDADGCFTSKLGMKMKHLTREEIRGICGSFIELSLNEKNAEALGGRAASGLYFIGKRK